MNIGQVFSSSKQNPAPVPLNVLRNLKIFIPYLDCTNMISLAGRTDLLQGFVSTVTRRKQESTTREEAGEKTFLYITESTLSIFLALLTKTKNLKLRTWRYYTGQKQKWCVFGPSNSTAAKARFLVWKKKFLVSLENQQSFADQLLSQVSTEIYIEKTYCFEKKIVFLLWVPNKDRKARKVTISCYRGASA